MASSFRDQFELALSLSALRSYVAEFISTFLFVFATLGTAMSASKIQPELTSDPSCLVAVALAHWIALFAAVYLATDVSGGHLNPAVTFAMVIGGHVSVSVSIFYWASQLLGSILASLILSLVSVGQSVPTTKIAEEMTGFGGAILEGITTFTLVYTIFLVSDQRKGISGYIGPMVIGCVGGANMLATIAFTGGSMNPARSFGPALVNGDFKNHGVYWVGPLVGAAVAVLFYQTVMFPVTKNSAHASGSMNNPVNLEMRDRSLA